MNKEYLQEYIENNIPMSKLMRFQIESLRADDVRISAPLDIHVNHRGSAFGGSISSLLIMNGWVQVRLIMDDINPNAVVVATENTVRYLKPVLQNFTAISKPIDPAELQRFIHSYEHTGKARIKTSAVIITESGPEELAKFEGTFAVFRKS